MKRVQTVIEVRYLETDQMGVVHHANYLTWFEIGRTKFVQSLGLEYASMEKDGVVSPVIDVKINYIKPVHYGEKVFVETWIEKYDGLRTLYGYEVKNEQNETAVKGHTQHVIVRRDNFRPLSLRRNYPVWHHAYLSAMGVGD